MKKGPLEVRFAVVERRLRNKWWNTTAAMFLDVEHRSVFTHYGTALGEARAHKGQVVSVSEYAIRLIKYADAPRRVVDILECEPTRTGHISPILVSNIEMALARGEEVTIEKVRYSF